MAARVVKVELVLAAQGYMQGVDAAAKKTRELGSEAEKLAQKRDAFNLLGASAVGFGAAVATGVGLAISRFAEFDQQMSYVQAATHETAGNMDLLRDAAMDAGARTVFSATEAAQAVEELSKAGVSTADVLSGALDGALDAAAAGGMAVAQTAELMASTLSQFNLEGSEASHVADLLAAGAGKAQGDMSDLGSALSQAGLVANQFGLSVDDTVGTLAAFANAGMMGSDAGTSLRTMLLRLANPTKEVAGLMQETGIQAYNTAGDFVGLDNLAGQLQSSLGDMTQAQRDQTLAMIFGQDAIRGANILMNEGAEGIQKWTDAVNDQGYAADTAAIRLDNLKGDLEALGGAFDTAMISMGEGANGPLRLFVQELTGMVDQFNSLPDWAQQTALGIGTVTAAVALGSGAFMLGVPKVAEYNAAIKNMGTGAQRTARLIGFLGKAAGVAAGLFALAKGAEMVATGLGQMGDGAKTANETMSLLLEQDYDGLFEGVTPAITDMDDALHKLLDNDWQTAFNRFGSDAFAWTGFTSSVGEAREQFSLLGQSLADMVNSGDADRAADIFDELREKAEAQGYPVEKLNELMPEYQDALTGVANESKIAGDATDGATGDFEDIGAAAEESREQIDGMREALLNVGRTALDMGDAQDAAQSAMNSMVEAAKAADVSLHGTNDTSIAFRDSLREVEETSREAAASMVENGESADEATAAYQRSRDAILDQIQPYFESREAAAAWADETLGSASEAEQGIRDFSYAVSNIPDPKPVKVTIDTSEASRGVSQWLTNNSGHTIRVKVHADGSAIDMGNYGRTISSGAVGRFHDYQSFAAGGFASGIYAGTAGSIHKFAEPWLPWETYISGDPGMRKRNIGIWQETGERLGVWQQPTISAWPQFPPAAAAPSQEVNVTQNIHAVPGMSESQVAAIAADRLNRELRGA